MHLNAHDQAELRAGKTPVLTSQWARCAPTIATLLILGRDGIKLAQPAKPRKITIGGAQRKPVFHGEHSEMSVCYKIAVMPGSVRN
jgi:hypothetical protein